MNNNDISDITAAKLVVNNDKKHLVAGAKEDFNCKYLLK